MNVSRINCTTNNITNINNYYYLFLQIFRKQFNVIGTQYINLFNSKKSTDYKYRTSRQEIHSEIRSLFDSTISFQ